jgi:hypothetical protein
MSDDGLIHFRTRAQRAAEADRACQETANAEAIRMLEQSLAYAKAQANEGRLVSGVAIGMVFSDRCYASHIPVDADNYGLLIAAVADCQYRLQRLISGHS